MPSGAKNMGREIWHRLQNLGTKHQVAVKTAPGAAGIKPAAPKINADTPIILPILVISYFSFRLSHLTKTDFRLVWSIWSKLRCSTAFSAVKPGVRSVALAVQEIMKKQKENRHERI